MFLRMEIEFGDVSVSAFVTVNPSFAQPCLVLVCATISISQVVSLLKSKSDDDEYLLAPEPEAKADSPLPLALLLLLLFFVVALACVWGEEAAVKLGLGDDIFVFFILRGDIILCDLDCFVNFENYEGIGPCRVTAKTKRSLLDNNMCQGYISCHISTVYLHRHSPSYESTRFFFFSLLQYFLAGVGE